MKVEEILRQEVEAYFSTLRPSDYDTVKDCSGIVYNFIVRHTPTPTEIQRFVRLLYGDLKYHQIKSIHES